MSQITMNFSDDSVLCYITMGRYLSHNQIYIQLNVAEDYKELSFEKGDEFTVATVCVVGYTFDSNQTAIKNYSENEGMLDALSKAGIAKQTDYATDRNSGFSAPLVTVAEDYLKIFEIDK